jgi:hypothetical protein
MRPELLTILTIDSSCRPNFFGAGAFGATALFELHLLADLELLDGSSLDLAVVEEQVTLVSLDEPKTLVCDHFFDRPLRHVRHSSQKQKLN